MAKKTAISKNLSENIAHMEELFHTCDDIKKKQMNIGKDGDVACYLTFIEVAVDRGGGRRSFDRGGDSLCGRL